MQDLSLFTYKEAINMISGFYTFTLGFGEFDLEQYPEVKRFIEKGYAEKDEEYDDLYVLNNAGEKVLHGFIKDISERFIKYMKGKGKKVAREDIFKWFQDEFELDTIEDGEDIAQYICGENLRHYGYRIRGYLGKYRNFYEIEPVITEF